MLQDTIERSHIDLEDIKLKNETLNERLQKARDEKDKLELDASNKQRDLLDAQQKLTGLPVIIDK